MNLPYMIPAPWRGAKRVSQNCQEKIEGAFGTSNQCWWLWFPGNYEAEEKTLKEIEKLDYVDSALRLANVSINDDYVLTDKISA